MTRKLILLALVAGLAAGCAAPAPAGPMPAIDTGIDAEAWALVPAGDFLMGLHAEPVTVDHDYAIMVTLVTNAQYARYLNEALAAGAVKIDGEEVVGYYPGDEFHGYKHEEEIAAGDWLHVPLAEEGLRLSFDGERFEPLPGYENHPMVHVTWFGAQAFCEFYGWRLPTEVEWEKAARGPDGRAYPWGDEIAYGNANFYATRHVVREVLGSQGVTTPVGFYNGRAYEGFQTLDSPSPYGLYDMAGNVWQWTGDVYDKIHYRYMRGGSKANHEPDLRAWARNSAGPDYHGPSVGFRCVRDAD